ncbi:hypothetical protein [Vacuolonema iberomarrocanum]|uniref:hypothetical protein n=1 Tax=Vacuolonema iberomarrocanum TaxID=3454632 RepID=UPI0019FA9404|nr:hypothetical protein [filamentous cyanobacterium LEGE 07170]
MQSPLSLKKRWHRFWSLLIAVVLCIKGCTVETQSSPPQAEPSGADTITTAIASSEFADFASTTDPTTLASFTLPSETFEDRAQQLIEYHATHPPNRDREGDPTGYVKSGVYTAMAQYAFGQTDAANQLADDLFSNPHSASMFLAMAGMDLYMRYNAVMPDDVKEKARRFITSFDDYTGGSTENHGIMFATAGYLAAQEWSDWDKADAVREETRSHLYDFVDEITQHGIVEHDSPIYHVFFVNSLLALRDHAADPEMQQRATVGLDLLLTSMAPEWLEGYWATSTLRSANFTHDPRRLGSLTGPVGWLYWGGDEPIHEDGCAVMSAVSDYRIPEVLTYIGQDRRLPYVHRETQGQSFNRDDKYRKYTYMDETYAMYSQFDGNGDLAWHDQLNRMGVVWVSDAPGSTLVIKQPVDDRGRGDTADGQVLQHERALIGVYRNRLSGYLPDTEAVVERIEEDGWMFVHGGTALIALKVVNGYNWEDTIDVLGTPFQSFRSNADRNGIVIQTASVEDFAADSPRAALTAFAEAVKTQTELDTSGIDNRRPRLRFVSLSGDVLEMEFSGDRTINGEVVDYHSWPLFQNPWMRSEAGTFLEIKYGDQSRRYDFQNWSIEDAGAES